MSGSSTVGCSSGPVVAGWSGSGGRGPEVLPRGSPGPVGRQVQHEPPGGGRDPGRDGDQLGAQGRPAGLGVLGPGGGSGGAEQVERDGGQGEPSAVGLEAAGGYLEPLGWCS